MFSPHFPLPPSASKHDFYRNTFSLSITEIEFGSRLGGRGSGLAPLKGASVNEFEFIDVPINYFLIHYTSSFKNHASILDSTVTVI